MSSTTPASQYDYKAMNLNLWFIYRETVECVFTMLPTVARLPPVNLDEMTNNIVLAKSDISRFTSPLVRKCQCLFW